LKYLSQVLGLSGALFAAACGATDGDSGSITDATNSAFGGIYQLTRANENKTSCVDPGASTLTQLKDQFFVITGSELFGQKYLMLNSCSSVSDCQAKRAKQLANQPYQIEYTYTLSSSANASTLNGFSASTGTGEGTQCVRRTYADHVLTLATDHGVHLESRLKNLPDHAMTSDGFCEVQPAQSKQEAAGVACSSLKELDGQFLQAM